MNLLIFTKKYMRVFFFIITVFGGGHLFAQSDNPLKFTGFIQIDGRFLETENDGYESTIGVRRGFFKSTYTGEWGQAALQVNATEKGIGVRDAHIKLQVPNLEWISLTAGSFLRPFGYEIFYSASARETPERARVITSIFPDERDIGVMLSLIAPQQSSFNGLKLDFGFVNGNGLAFEDKAKYGKIHKDFISRLFYNKSLESISFGVGASFYSGKVMLFDGFEAFEMINGDFHSMKLTGGDMIQRRIFGFEGQFRGKTAAGNTTVRAEYLFGTQAGLIDKNVSNCAAGYLNGLPNDVYLRPFSGAYVYFIQDIFSPKHSAVFKYDVYNPNNKISGNHLKTDGDVKYTNIGAGYMFNPSSTVRVLAFYEWIANEKSNSISEKFQTDLKDNIFTVRLQYRF